MNNKFRQAAQHTPGRVKVQHPDAGERGWEVAFEPGLERLCADITEANARHLVACWNALQDFSTDAPAPRSHLLKAEDDQITMLTTQRDELLEALKKAAEHIEAMIIEHKPLRLKQHCWQQVRNARAAIAKVEGGAA